MKKIGLLSDTHGHLDPKILNHFKDCDEVWHGGDIGTMELANTLENFKPCRAVFGNIDGKDLQIRYAEDLYFQCEGVNVWITHIGGVPPNYNPRVKKLLTQKSPHLFICGHSHILRIKRDPSFDNMLYLNPGACGNHGFHHIKTIVRFELDAGKIQNMEVIELGKRGALT